MVCFATRVAIFMFFTAVCLLNFTSLTNQPEFQLIRQLFSVVINIINITS
jgi:hypothetical protein